MKKVYFFLLVLNSVLTFAQFGTKVKFTPENKIKYETIRNQLYIDLKILRNKVKEQKNKLKIQNGSTNFINYRFVKDSLCDAYVDNVSKLVPADQVRDFWTVVNRRMKK